MIKRHRNEKLIRAAGMRLRELREARGLSQEKVLFETNNTSVKIYRAKS